MIDFKKLQEEMRKQDGEYFFIVSGDKEFKAYNYYSVVQNDSITMMDGKAIVSSILETLYNKARVKNYKPVCITGDSDGIDSIAESYTNCVGSDVYVFQADWDKDGRRARYLANEEMFLFAARKKHKRCVLFWNGENKITLHLLYLAYLYNIQVIVFNYVQRRWMTKDEIEDIQHEEYLQRERTRRE